MQTRPINPDDFARLHQDIGVALWAIQAFEDTLARFIALILKLPPSRAEDEMHAVLRDLQSRTLGQLLHELRRANSSTAVSEFEQRMNRFLGERNWLVHKSWAAHHTDLFQPNRLPPLLRRLDKLAVESQNLQTIFVNLTFGWMLQQGHTAAEIERETARILQQSGVTD